MRVSAVEPVTGPGDTSSTAGSAGGSEDVRCSGESGSHDVSAPLRAVAAVAVLSGVLLRLYSASPLWLDEALTVNVARSGVDDLRDALARDGAPPVYYALLSIWTAAAGTSDLAVRLLSACFSVATIPLVHRMGLRRGGPAVALAAVVLFAVSPFAIRYATEARMYSLVALLVSAGWLALMNALDRPRPRWLLATAVCAGLLVLTHYWGFYLVAACASVLIWASWRNPGRRRTLLLAAGAMTGGAVVFFAPWFPTFLHQLQHTGTPWGIPPGPVEVAFTTLVDLGGGPYPEGQAIAAVLAALTILAVTGRALDTWRIEIDLRTRPGVRADLLVAALTLLAGVVIGLATDSAWASRYTSVAFPLVILSAAHGLRSLGSRRLVVLVLAAMTALGAAGGVRNALTPRTQAEEVAAAVAAAGGEAGDVIVYCPDQLGPDVHRALPPGFEHYTFPDLAGPELVDWVDYAERMASADPAQFARQVLRRAEGRDIFYVWMPGYRSLDKKCERVNDALGNARPGNRQLLDPDPDYFERQAVWLHPSGDR